MSKYIESHIDNYTWRRYSTEGDEKHICPMWQQYTVQCNSVHILQWENTPKPFHFLLYKTPVQAGRLSNNIRPRSS